MVDKVYDSLPDHLRSGRVLFRGFSIEKVRGIVNIRDIRHPHYKNVKKEDLQVLSEMGFVNGATYLLMLSDMQKIERYKSLEKKYTELIEKNDNPRKKQEYINLTIFCDNEVKYYESQVSRWHKQLDSVAVH